MNWTDVMTHFVTALVVFAFTSLFKDSQISKLKERLAIIETDIKNLVQQLTRIEQQTNRHRPDYES